MFLSTLLNRKRHSSQFIRRNFIQLLKDTKAQLSTLSNKAPVAYTLSQHHLTSGKNLGCSENKEYASNTDNKTETELHFLIETITSHNLHNKMLKNLEKNIKRNYYVLEMGNLVVFNCSSGFTEESHVINSFSHEIM